MTLERLRVIKFEKKMIRENWEKEFRETGFKIEKKGLASQVK